MTKTITMPIEEYDGLKNQIAKLESDIHKYTIDGKIKVESPFSLVLFYNHYRRSECKYGGFLSIKEGLTPKEVGNLKDKYFKKAVSDVYAFKRSLGDEVERMAKETEKLKEQYNMSFMQRLVYLFRGKL